jgi:hypothetical protein
MIGRIDATGLDRLSARLAQLAENIRPGGRAINQLKGDLNRIVVEGVQEALLQGIGPDGSTVAPLAASTVKRRTGSGPPRVPHGTSSRLYRNVVGVWDDAGGRQVLRVGFASVPFANYLHGGTGRMPARPIGVTPAMRERIAQRIARFPDDLRRSGGGRPVAVG